ncbi:hypothetical protein BY996DRAFT_6409190 [Phakopsora pachyrhizi]|uniref:Expressed protein n=1 Tax=Phakopsora pachyrhizi TaxID=170000 RepID=A0AAV0BIK0_PHAPC|nr:hypothetical protein BY996DRAFT_6409190 [Phakopsora pachyrhizi]CAH7687097.1 expressed protein [Phakopsora pachyrhizi]
MSSRRNSFEPARKRSASTYSVPEFTASISRGSLKALKWVGNKLNKGTESEDDEDDEELWGTSYEQYADEYHREKVPQNPFYSTTRSTEIVGAPQSPATSQRILTKTIFGSTNWKKSISRPIIPKSLLPSRKNSVADKSNPYLPLEIPLSKASQSFPVCSGEKSNSKPTRPHPSPLKISKSNFKFPSVYPSYSSIDSIPSSKDYERSPSFVQKLSTREIYALMTGRRSTQDVFLNEAAPMQGTSNLYDDFDSKSQTGYKESNEIYPVVAVKQIKHRNPPRRSKSVWEDDKW